MFGLSAWINFEVSSHLLNRQSKKSPITNQDYSKRTLLKPGLLSYNDREETKFPTHSITWFCLRPKDIFFLPECSREKREMFNFGTMVCKAAWFSESERRGECYPLLFNDEWLGSVDLIGWHQAGVDPVRRRFSSEAKDVCLEPEWNSSCNRGQIWIGRSGLLEIHLTNDDVKRFEDRIDRMGARSVRCGKERRW